MRSINHDKKKALTLFLSLLLILSFFSFNLVKAYAPVSITTLVGTYNSGNLDSILTEYDADYYHVTEIVADPAYDIRINFTDVITPFQSITLRAQYAGANNHLVCLRLWNYTSEAWDEYITLVDDTKQDEYTALVPSYQHYVSSDVVMMRVCHEENGNINDDLYIDYIHLNDVTGWLDGWNSRIELTLDSTDVDECLTDFPVLLHLSGSSGINNTDLTAIFDAIEEDYNATAYTMGDGLTRLYFDVENWDWNTTETANIFVAPYYVSNLTDTKLYLYYDTTQDGSDYHVPENIYTPFFVMVQHMEDATTLTLLDSTSNDNTLFKKDVNEPIEYTGKIGNAQFLDGINDYLNASAMLGYPNGFSLLMWVRTNITDKVMASQWTDGTTGGFGKFADGNWYVGDFDSWGVVSSGVLGDNDWHFYSLIWDSEADTLTSYLDSSQVAQDTLTAIDTLNGALSGFVVGGDNRASPPSNLMSGVFDEIKIFNSTLNESWIKTSYETEMEDFIYYSEPEIDYSIDDVLRLAAFALIIALIGVALVLINSKK